MAKRGEKVCNNGEWTQARFNSFIKSALRNATGRWGPKQSTLKKARVRRGFYLCNSCKEEVPTTLPPKPGNKKRIKNAIVDHINPVIDPTTGFTTWDSFIGNLFCEEENLQVVCHACHQVKCNEEKEIAKNARSRKP